jgi:uncharacterized membrane protein
VARNKRRNQQRQQDESPPGRSERQVVSATWLAPIPPPALLESYNSIVDNGAERIVRMAEKAQDADIAMGRGWLALYQRGQLMGAIVSTVALVLAAVLGAYGLHAQAPATFYVLPAALVSVPVFAVIKALVSRDVEPPN